MKDLTSALEGVGFHEKKARIYLALLELGEGSVIEIAKKAGLKRTTVYNILPELLDAGYIRRMQKQKHNLFYVEDVRDLKRSVEEQERSIAAILPQLSAIHNVLPSKPHISFYEGHGGMRALYQDILDSVREGDTVLSFTGLADFHQLVPQEFSEWYIRERVKRKFRARIIAPESPTSQLWLANAPKELRDIRLITNEPFAFNADAEIYGDKVALLSYKEGFMGVIIESKEIAAMHRASFEVMWNAIDKDKVQSVPTEATEGTD